MKKDRKWLWIIAGIIVALLLYYFISGWLNRDMVSVKATKVVRGTIEEVIIASGIVDAPVYDLGPKMGGKIMVINVREGQRVYAGQTLAEFDDTTRLVAPAGGVVAKINYDIGETVPMGVPAIVVVNYAKSWVNAQIDEVDIANVKIGDKVKITSDVYPDKIFDGVIYWIAPIAELRKVGGRVKMDEESYVFPCKVRFIGDHSDLKVNMSVNVDIATRKSENTLLLPREALYSKDDSSYVYVVKRGRVHQTPISIGIRSYTSIEASSGLEEGSEVAVTNLNKLKDKGRVKLER